jgi:hydroxylamine reductase (hybrid-cluster protein)
MIKNKNSENLYSQIFALSQEIKIDIETYQKYVIGVAHTKLTLKQMLNEPRLEISKQQLELRNEQDKTKRKENPNSINKNLKDKINQNLNMLLGMLDENDLEGEDFKSLKLFKDNLIDNNNQEKSENIKNEIKSEWVQIQQKMIISKAGTIYPIILQYLELVNI